MKILITEQNARAMLMAMADSKQPSFEADLVASGTPGFLKMETVLQDGKIIPKSEARGYAVVKTPVEEPVAPPPPPPGTVEEHKPEPIFPDGLDLTDSSALLKLNVITLRMVAEKSGVSSEGTKAELINAIVAKAKAEKGDSN